MGINYDTTQQDCCKNDRLLKYFLLVFFYLLHAVQFFKGLFKNSVTIKLSLFFTHYASIHWVERIVEVRNVHKQHWHNYIFYSPLKIKKDNVVQLCGVQTTMPIFITLISINNDIITRQLGCYVFSNPYQWFSAYIVCWRYL